MLKRYRYGVADKEKTFGPQTPSLDIVEKAAQSVKMGITTVFYEICIHAKRSSVVRAEADAMSACRCRVSKENAEAVGSPQRFDVMILLFTITHTFTNILSFPWRIKIGSRHNLDTFQVDKPLPRFIIYCIFVLLP